MIKNYDVDPIPYSVLPSEDLFNQYFIVFGYNTLCLTVI